MNKQKNFKKGRMNRVLLLMILIFIIVISIIGILNNNNNKNNSKYGDKEIRALISKGYESIENYSIDSYSAETNKISQKIYKKGDIKKIINVENNSEQYINMTKKKLIVVDHDEKTNTQHNREKNDVLGICCANWPYIFKENEVGSYKYIKEEKYRGTDCILVKKININTKTGKLDEGQKHYLVYWIEKDTGYIKGRGLGSAFENKENTYFENLKFNTVDESYFELPKSYTCYESMF